MGRRYTEYEVRQLVRDAVREATEPLEQRITELEREVDQLRRENDQLRRENDQLRRENAQLKKDSSTSSKPPSSDIVKPKKLAAKHKGKRKRRRGGQPGHEKHEREMFEPEQVDHVYEYDWPDAGELIPLHDWHVVQQVELVDRPFVVREHRARKYRCPRTGRIVVAPLPDDVQRGGLLGPRFSAYVGYLKGGCRMSYTLIHELLRDVMGLTISRGHLSKVVGKVSAAIAPAHEQLLEALPRQDRLGVDETGRPDSGRRLWTWCFRAERFAAYRIMASRGSDVLRQTPGEVFGGVLSCDFFSAYRKYGREMPGWVQFCLAHLIRDVKHLTTLADRCVSRWARKLRDAIQAMFRTYHREDELTERGFERAMVKAQDRILKIGKRPPPRSEAQALAERFRKHGKAYFTFLHHEGVEPTNNLTEQALRFVVLDRKATQGTRGENGRRWCERIWSVRETCRLQQRSAFTFIAEAVQAHFINRSAPLLL